MRRSFTVKSSVGDLRPKSNYLLEPEPEPKLRLLSIYQRLEMVAEEVFVNCYNFNPIRVTHESVYVKKNTFTRVKKGILSVILKNYSEPEPPFGFTAP
jgi:hypothetical protein